MITDFYSALRITDYHEIGLQSFCRGIIKGLNIPFEKATFSQTHGSFIFGQQKVKLCFFVRLQDKF